MPTYNNMSYVMCNGNNYQQPVNPSPVMMCPHMGGGITPPQHHTQMCGIDCGDQGLCGYNMKHSPCNCIYVPIMELVQMNGRKVLGPPEDWIGPPPTSACELFVRRIPKNLNEHKLLAPFLRFGRIYELRLPMDFNQANRGYAYVKYTTEEDAACAMEVLNHYYVAPHLRLEILHSYEKCRLFINNIPKHLDEFEIEEKLRVVFPKMQRVYGRAASAGPPIEDSNPNSLGLQTLTLGDVNNNNFQSAVAGGGGNRGHVFVQFASHLHALEAKKSVNPGLIRLWGRDLKVVWANTGRDYGVAKTQSKTLFVRNVDLTINNRDLIGLLVQYVPRTVIRKVSKVRTTAFLDFTSREAAELCLKQLQGVFLKSRRLDLEWAKPSEQQSLHRMRNMDYDAVLRLKCIANGWGIPVVIFSCYYEQERLQYGAIMLRDSMGNVRAIFLIMNCSELVDIHSRMCEVVCVLIETIGTFPDYNYVFHVEKDTAHLLGMVAQNIQSVDFIASCGVPTDFFFDYNEIIDLGWAIYSLTHVSEEALLAAYMESFRVQSECSYLQNWPLIPHRIFGTIMPKYRNKPPLNYKLNDTQIVLALCFKATGVNAVLPTRPYLAFCVCAFDNGFEGLRYVTLKLLPIALTQSRFAATHILSHVQFGGCKYYHPAQRIMVPPLWVAGCSYFETIKQAPIYNKPNVPYPSLTNNYVTTAAAQQCQMPSTSSIVNQQQPNQNQQQMFLPAQQTGGPAMNTPMPNNLANLNQQQQALALTTSPNYN